MKIRISFTVNVGADFRRAIVHYYGDDSRRLATRKEVQDWFKNFGNTMGDTLADEHGACCMGVSEP